MDNSIKVNAKLFIVIFIILVKIYEIIKVACWHILFILRIGNVS